MNRAVESLAQGMVITDPRLPDNPIIFINKGFEKMTGYSASEIVGKNCRFLQKIVQGGKTDPIESEKIRDSIRMGKGVSCDILNYRKNGTPFWNHLEISPVIDDDGVVTHFVGFQTDITHRRLMEDQQRQSQKMEAIGRLTGGISHDFNNLLTVINGCSELLLNQHELTKQDTKLIQEIFKAGEKASTLTRQLLNFSRDLPVENKLVNVNEIVHEVENLIRRLIGNDVKLDIRLAEKIGLIHSDPTQIEQILINLVINAKDAMPKGGEIEITTENITHDPFDSKTKPESIPADFILLSVRDTGIGMNAEVQSKVFEPFFTTKKTGTGFGLATVYRIVTQHNGHILVRSKEGHGSTFLIYFPIETKAYKKASITPNLHLMPKGTETVLLAEDDEGLRAIQTKILDSCGYKVIEAEDGIEALALLMSNKDPIDLVVLDVIMPYMGGTELEENISKLGLNCKKLFVSGYSQSDAIHRGYLNEHDHFLQKPFSTSSFAQKVRQVLNDAPC